MQTPPATPFRFVYVSAPSREVALTLGRMAVNARLAACANVLDGMISIYWWDEKLNEDAESVLILKTREDKLAELMQALKAQHPYDCPCIVALPIVAGNPDYLNWLQRETNG
ncbi:MAG TPA: divalent-cation tolerance protein CutA [Polyangiaceae bacterium]|nr:divalent-cation tolerance protein CutA [Polyangiaceae bacterium]